MDRARIEGSTGHLLSNLQDPAMRFEQLFTPLFNLHHSGLVLFFGLGFAVSAVAGPVKLTGLSEARLGLADQGSCRTPRISRPDLIVRFATRYFEVENAHAKATQSSATASVARSHHDRFTVDFSVPR